MSWRRYLIDAFLAPVDARPLTWRVTVTLLVHGVAWLLLKGVDPQLPTILTLMVVLGAVNAVTAAFADTAVDGTGHVLTSDGGTSASTGEHSHRSPWSGSLRFELLILVGDAVSMVTLFVLAYVTDVTVPVGLLLAAIAGVIVVIFVGYLQARWARSRTGRASKGS